MQCNHCMRPFPWMNTFCRGAGAGVKQCFSDRSTNAGELSRYPEEGVGRDSWDKSPEGRLEKGER